MIKAIALAGALALIPSAVEAAVNPRQPVNIERGGCGLTLIDIELEARYKPGYMVWRQLDGIVVSNGTAWAEFWCYRGALQRLDGLPSAGK